MNRYTARRIDRDRTVSRHIARSLKYGTPRTRTGR